MLSGATTNASATAASTAAKNYAGYSLHRPTQQRQPRSYYNPDWSSMAHGAPAFYPPTVNHPQSQDFYKGSRLRVSSDDNTAGETESTEKKPIGSMLSVSAKEFKPQTIVASVEKKTSSISAIAESCALEEEETSTANDAAAIASIDSFFASSPSATAQKGQHAFAMDAMISGAFSTVGGNTAPKKVSAQPQPQQSAGIGIRSIDDLMVDEIPEPIGIPPTLAPLPTSTFNPNTCPSFPNRTTSMAVSVACGEASASSHPLQHFVSGSTLLPPSIKPPSWKDEGSSSASFNVQALASLLDNSSATASHSSSH